MVIVVGLVGSVMASLAETMIYLALVIVILSPCILLLFMILLLLTTQEILLLVIVDVRATK